VSAVCQIAHVISAQTGTLAGMVPDAADLEARFFALSIDMLCIAHFSGHFRRLSPAWQKTLGFSEEELREKPMFDFVHPDDRARTIEQNRLVKAGGQALAFENRYRCKDGSYRWLLWNAQADREHQVIYSVARDITERKEAEAQREQLVRELQAALAEVRELQKILPICMYCRKIRNDQNYWQTVEVYIAHHTNSRFSHGICPSCLPEVLRNEGITT
jgi:PAS domain S-box-containing protein